MKYFAFTLLIKPVVNRNKTGIGLFVILDVNY